MSVHDDPHGLGVEKMAKIIMEITMRDMGGSAPKAFSLGYVDPEWRAMHRRIFRKNRDTYEAAKAALEEARCK